MYSLIAYALLIHYSFIQSFRIPHLNVHFHSGHGRVHGPTTWFLELTHSLTHSKPFKMSKAAAKTKKDEGNALFKDKKYEEAIAKYTEAIALDSNDVTFYSNRSACYAAIEKYTEAAEDGRQCVIVDKNFVKGYFRAALGLQKIGNLDGALEYVKRGLGIESSNPDLKKMSRELEDSIRSKKVDSLIEKVEQSIATNDIPTAYKTLETALRLEPTDAKLNRLMDQVKPKYERLEKERVASLDSKERLKEEGDKLFKDAKFEEAIKAYTKALSSITDKSSELALKCYSNRAACYKQISNFDGTVEDCTCVLEHNPNDVKALVRRAQALEACERYKSAMQDVRQVLLLGVDVAGKANYDLANGMQHRLTRVIAELKKG